MDRKILVRDPESEILQELSVSAASKNGRSGWRVALTANEPIFIYKKGRCWQADEHSALRAELVQAIGEAIIAKEDKVI